MVARIDFGLVPNPYLPYKKSVEQFWPIWINGLYLEILWPFLLILDLLDWQETYWRRVLILWRMLHGWVCYFFNRLILADGHVRNYKYHIFLDHAAFKIISLGFETLLSTEFRTIDLCTYVLISPLVVWVDVWSTSDWANVLNIVLT